MKIKIISLTILIILASGFSAFCQNTNSTEPNKTDGIFIHLNIPTIVFSPIATYDCNILQSYGLGLEYKFKGKFGLSFDFVRELQDFEYNTSYKRTIFSSFIYNPSLKYYVDSNSKFFVNLGAAIASCNDEITENNIVNEEKYMQNAITTGVGYKVYLSANKRFGGEIFLGTKILIWEKGRNNYLRKTILDDAFNFKASIFYRF